MKKNLTKKYTRTIIISFIILSCIVLIILLQKALVTRTKNIPQLSTKNLNTAGEKAMEAISQTGVAMATETKGNQVLSYTMDNGVKVFHLTAEPVRWNILKDTIVTAWTYNGTVPGPIIHVTNGDKVRIIVKNTLFEPTTIHWHGIQVPNNMDGIPDMTQKPIKPGEIFTYEFVAKPAGTY